MNLVFILLLINGVFGQSGFGSSYLGDSKLCEPWSCINKALGLDDTLPPKERYSSILRSILPPGSWHGVVDDVLNICYGNKPKRYTNTCPGQALLHCVVDTLINNCPEESLRKNDACAPVASLAGFKYMFSQSRYINFEESIALESRPIWFLKHYFNSKCCNLPQYYNTTILSNCGFNSVVHYYEHAPRLRNTHKNDPLECCNLSDILPPPQSRKECGFGMKWDSQKRLEIVDDGVMYKFRTTKNKSINHDVKVVPLSCEQESCVFKQLDIVSEDGTVNIGGFTDLLNKFSIEHPIWIKAKGRVITRCLTKPIKDYEADCEINKVLACTFDVLSENCPHTRSTRIDPCKHTYTMKNNTLCQISSSKLIRNRRQYCDFPRFVSHEVLEQCKINSINRLEFVPASPPRSSYWRKPMSLNSECKESLPSTVCLMSKMDVLNKYNFMDHFKIRDKLASFKLIHPEWNTVDPNWDINSLVYMPLYTEFCSSQRKLLNVMDSMLMNCPASQRRNTTECNKLFNEIAPMKAHQGVNITRQKNTNQLEFDQKHQTFGPPIANFKVGEVNQKNNESVFNSFLFIERNIPLVTKIPIKPSKMYAKNRVRVVTPVYMRSTRSSKEETRKDSHKEPEFSYVD